MRYLSLNEVLDLYQQIMKQSGGAIGIRDLGALESSMAQPRMSFDGKDLYPSIVEKASALCFFLVMNHPFIDGNKRIGHAAMEIFLVLNGYEIEALVDDQEKVIFNLASGKINQNIFNEWLCTHIKSRL